MARRACHVRKYRDNFGFRIIEEMVHYAYTGQLHITRDNVFGVFHLALIWQMESVLNWCAGFIVSRYLELLFIHNNTFLCKRLLRQTEEYTLIMQRFGWKDENS